MNVFQYAFAVEKNWKMNLADMGSFVPQYTFYSDFGIAEFCEVYMKDRNAVKKTYNNVIKSWGDSYKALTEIIMVLNHKAWSFSENVDSHYLKCGEQWKAYYTKLYTELYNKTVNIFFEKYKDNEDAKKWYYRITD